MEPSMSGFHQFDSVVRIVTGHVVSSSSMVTRAYLKDSWRAVIVRGDDGMTWLASTLDALAPDEEALIQRGEEAGGPPARYATPSLVKISIAWGGLPGRPTPPGEAHVTNPRVVRHPGGASIALVSLSKAGGLIRAMDEGLGPVPIDVGIGEGSSVDDAAVAGAVVAATLFDDGDGRHWPVRRTARIATETGVDFLGQSGAFALDLELQESDAGTPVFSSSGTAGAFVGLTQRVGPGLAILLPRRLIAETVA
jgi:hypothetical protein